ncbi:MAG: radical SAM protein [Candidatus Mcinerneyibacterium aminivorans]|uniref:Radical SAM protein n=1 Tax=Candidatus Mcinerneyibacterium aminivorans TaxID=2703815 RepID=A0A5D0MD62_9BACT|nr:MAG: radical SAM protein [Candidatus Mcinerneyibacterium aminivorans]
MNYAQLRNKAIKKRNPFCGGFELTYKCNFNCIHCYVDSEYKKNGKENELSKEEIIKIVKAIKLNGGAVLTLTGGECLLREDFIEIYRYIKKNGLIVDVFTNGTNFTNKIIDIFQKYPPRIIDISCYGFSDKTYKKVTKVKNSFYEFKKGIKLLKKNDLLCNTRIKYFILKQNVDELDKCKKYCKTNNINLTTDYSLHNSFNGKDIKNLYQISPKELVDKVIKKIDSVKQFYQKSYKKRKHSCNRFHDYSLWRCLAGLISYTITPKGKLKLCSQYNKNEIDINSNNFGHVWDDMIPKIMKKSNSDICKNCKNNWACKSCAAWTDVPEKRKNLENICEYTKNLIKYLKEYNIVGDK